MSTYAINKLQPILWAAVAIYLLFVIGSWLPYPPATDEQVRADAYSMCQKTTRLPKAAVRCYLSLMAHVQLEKAALFGLGAWAEAQDPASVVREGELQPLKGEGTK